MPSEPSPQAVAVPPLSPPRDTQEAMIAPPIPPKKPAALPAEKTVSTTPSQSQDAASPTAEDSHVGEGGYDKYLRDMKMQILRHYFYPPTAEMFHLTGTAVYDITLDRSGQVRHVKLTQSAGEVLDKAGFNAIMRSSPFGPLPDEFRGADGVVVTLVFPMPVADQ
jgi:protein TonB